MYTKIQTLLASLQTGPAWPELSAGEARTLAILAVMTLLFLCEAWLGTRAAPAQTVRRSYFANFGTLIFNDVLMSALSVTSLLAVAERYSDRGILGAVENPLAKTVASFVLLDLLMYAWHRANHAHGWLWMFHKVHHSDLCMNVSTAFRLHFMEVLLTTLVKAAFIVVVGVDAATVALNETAMVLFVMLHHTNISFWGERWLGRVFVVPYLHRAHHSALRSEHDLNLGAVFSLWDRLLGTFTEAEPKFLGLQQLPVHGQGFMELIKYGLTQVAPPSSDKIKAMIAEAAYFRAERRGFTPGDDFRDWLEAEREIRAFFGFPPKRQGTKSKN
jgi:sterol desaturase/sphingolipid hydroxylase (fatty acid hydroxylase superfamily)